jgi:hypothetical protein
MVFLCGGETGLADGNRFLVAQKVRAPWLGCSKSQSAMARWLRHYADCTAHLHAMQGRFRFVEGVTLLQLTSLVGFLQQQLRLLSMSYANLTTSENHKFEGG